MRVQPLALGPDLQLRCDVGTCISVRRNGADRKRSETSLSTRLTNVQIGGAMEAQPMGKIGRWRANYRSEWDRGMMRFLLAWTAAGGAESACVGTVAAYAVGGAGKIDEQSRDGEHIPRRSSLARTAVIASDHTCPAKLGVGDASASVGGNAQCKCGPILIIVRKVDCFVHWRPESALPIRLHPGPGSAHNCAQCLC